MEETGGFVIGLLVLGDIPLCLAILYITSLLVPPIFGALQLGHENSYMILDERSRGTVSFKLKNDPIVSVLVKKKQNLKSG